MVLQAVGALPFSDAEEYVPAVSRLSNWISNGARLASQASGWHRVMQDAPKLAFVYPSDADVLVGALTPSTNRSGRPFGFAVVQQARDPLVRGLSATIPCADPAFFDDCFALLDKCRADGSWEDVRERVGQAPAFFEHGCAVIAENFMAVSSKLGGVKLVSALLGPERAAHGVSRLLRTVRARVGHSRGPRALRLPLYQGDPRATALVWLSLIRTAARWTNHAPFVVWTNSGDAPWMQVQLDDRP